MFYGIYFNDIKKLTVTNCIFNTVDNVFYVDDGTSCTEITLTKNKLEECLNFIILADLMTYSIISDNIITRSTTSGTAILISVGIDFSVISNNIIKDYTTGIQFVGSSNNTISDNVFEDGTNSMTFASSPYNAVNGNTISNYSTGIVVNSGSVDMTINGNNIYNSSTESITINTVSNVLCVGNMARDGITGAAAASTGNITS
jgi:parallel beta-helix repeat protein